MAKLIPTIIYNYDLTFATTEKWRVWEGWVSCRRFSSSLPPLTRSQQFNGHSEFLVNLQKRDV
jgi:hypothetical protein